MYFAENDFDEKNSRVFLFHSAIFYDVLITPEENRKVTYL